MNINDENKGAAFMLTPMMIQYLVGLCCLRHNPDAIDITLGDRVYDCAAEKARDVDITVTLRNEEGMKEIFKAVEVKAESKAIDVETVEQLCLKLSDMERVTHKSIFSTSGYTDGARSKAKAHSVDLYTLSPWTMPIEDDFKDFAGVGRPSDFLTAVDSYLLHWMDETLFVVVPDGPESFEYSENTPVYSSLGKRHEKFLTMGEFKKEMVEKSGTILYTQPAAVEMLGNDLSAQNSGSFIGKPWPFTHQMPVKQENAYLKFEKKLCQINSVVIQGQLRWEIEKLNPQFYILKNIETNEIFAGAAIAAYGKDNGRMFAMVFPDKGRNLGIHQVVIPQKQRSMLRMLKIKE